MEVVNEVANLFAQKTQHFVLRHKPGLTRGKQIRVQERDISLLIISTPSQTVRHVLWRFRPAPGTAPETIGNIACSLASTLFLAPSGGAKQRLAVLFKPAGPWKGKHVQKPLAVYTAPVCKYIHGVHRVHRVWQNVHYLKLKKKKKAKLP